MTSEISVILLEAKKNELDFLFKRISFSIFDCSSPKFFISFPKNGIPYSSFGKSKIDKLDKKKKAVVKFMAVLTNWLFNTASP